MRISAIAGNKCLSKIVTTAQLLTSEILINNQKITLKFYCNYRQGHGIKRKRANSGNVVDTGGYCNTPNGTAPYNGANHHQHLTGGRLLDCGNNGKHYHSANEI